MTTKEELFREEEAVWAEVHGIAHALTAEQALEPFSEDWAIKDLLAHLSCWFAECAQALCQIRLGTYTGRVEDEDEANRRFLEATRDLDHDGVIAQLHASRSRMLEELNVLPEERLDDEAVWWFRECGAEHHRVHLPQLRERVEALGAGPASAADASDPKR